MAAVQIPNISWPSFRSSRIGPFQATNGRLWVIGKYSYIQPVYSDDGGNSWFLGRILGPSTITQWDCVFDSSTNIIYVVTRDPTDGIKIQSLDLTTTTENWTTISTGTPPAMSTDVNGLYPIFLTRRSTGEFVVFYQGPTHSSMGSAYRSVYYARCSAAGVWSAGVEVDAGGAFNYDCKGACLGASDRVHMLYAGSAPSELHRSLDSNNTFASPDTIATGVTAANYATIYYNAILNKVIITALSSSQVFRGSSSATPGWTSESASVVGESGYCAPVLIYEPTDAKLYSFYRDATSDDLYQNSASGTTWGTPVVQDGTLFGQNDKTTYNTQTNVYGGSGTQEQIAQTFQVPVSLVVPSVGLNLTRWGTPTDSVTLDLCADSGGSPGTVLASSTVASAGWGQTNVKFPFSSPPTLSASTTYWLVLRREGARDINNCYRAWGASSDLYANGSAKYRSSGTWANGTVVYDLYFEIPFGVTVTGISVGLITDAIGVIFNDSGVYFDKLVLAAPPEPIEPVTTNEEFFALL